MITLEENVFGVLVVITVEENGVGGGGEFGRTVVTVGEEGSGTLDVHTVETVQSVTGLVTFKEAEF